MPCTLDLGCSQGLYQVTMGVPWRCPPSRQSQTLKSTEGRAGRIPERWVTELREERDGRERKKGRGGGGKGTGEGILAS